MIGQLSGLPHDDIVGVRIDFFAPCDDWFRCAGSHYVGDLDHGVVVITDDSSTSTGNIAHVVVRLVHIFPVDSFVLNLK